MPGCTSDKIVLYNPDDPTQEIGDFRGSGSNFYTMGPGSIHPDTGKTYTGNDKQPLLMKWSEVESFLKPFLKRKKIPLR